MASPEKKVCMTFPMWQLAVAPAALLVYFAVFFLLTYQIATLSIFSAAVISGFVYWFYTTYIDDGSERERLPNEETKHMNVCIIGMKFSLNMGGQ